MNKILLRTCVISACMFSSSLLAATGEWWEITGKMEMEGMPFAMPAQTSKVCMPKGAESDPNYTQGKDSHCKMTDVKHSGNTVKFKGSCVNKGETMNVVGDTTHDGKSFKSNMKMSGKSQGQDMNMTVASSGKYVGGSCDTEEQGKKAKAQIDAGMAAACDTSKHNTVNWISQSSMYIGDKPSCPGKKEALCKALRNDVPRDVQAFQMLQQHEQDKKMPSAAQACGMDMEGIRKSLCKAKARSGPLYFLETSCPAEAKAYRELQRKQEECAGRGFTAGAKMKKCMGGEMLTDDAEETHPVKSSKAKGDTSADDSGSGGVNSDTVLEGAKKLKGLFGF